MREIWALVNEMSPYLLLGFAFAGLLHSFVPASLYRRYLGKKREFDISNQKSISWLSE